ncbi:MAG: DNA-binding protein, partial [Desulfococcus sp. 4484_241]
DCKIIISGDKHLRSLKKYIDIKILSPREFIDNMM